MIQLIASALTIIALGFIVCGQVLVHRNVSRSFKAYQLVIDRLLASGRKMGEGWVEVAQAIGEMQKRIELQEQRILNLEGRRWTVHNGGRREGSDDPTGGDAA